MIAVGLLAACDNSESDTSQPPPAPIIKTADRGDDAGMAEGDAEDAGSTACRSDEECVDSEFCDGAESCRDGRCVEAAQGPCADVLQCVGAVQRCDCDFDHDGIISARCGGPDCDEDADKHDAIECGGDDCDDTEARRYGGNTEVCDADLMDEDCVLTRTAGPSKEDDPIHYDRGRDFDEDGAISPNCRNVDPTNGQVYAQLGADYDCDDRDGTSAPGFPEVCDDKDNDCDGIVDEISGSGVDFGLRQEFCYDGDGDGAGVYTQHARFCSPPRHYTRCDPTDLAAEDCDDSKSGVRPGDDILEVCDAYDNDCDGKLNEEDRDIYPLPDQVTPDGRDTTLACVTDHWEITHCPDGYLWCDRSTFLRGCETSIRRLQTCQTCDRTDCHFSCGERGCDEIQRIAVGIDHACALTGEGRVACWGQGADGQLGNEPSQSSSIPAPVRGLTEVVEVATGRAHSCAVAGPERTLYCWGDNRVHQLGSPDDSQSSAVPVAVTGFNRDRMRQIASVATGNQHTCAADSGGYVYCWGDQRLGRLGDANDIPAGGAGEDPVPKNPRPVARPLPQSDPVEYDRIADAKRVSAGDRHTCVVTMSGRVECWGDNSYGQLGPGTSDAFLNYAQFVTAIQAPEQLAAGGYHTCVLSGGSVLCWGLNNYLQLGRPSDEHDREPLPVPGLHDVVEIAAGWTFTCARLASGEVVCWGDLGFVGNSAGVSGPLTAQLGQAVSLAAGGFVCAVQADSTAACFGNNFQGQLGRGSTMLEPDWIPQALKPLAGSE